MRAIRVLTVSAAAACVASLLWLPAPAQSPPRASGLQITPDGKRTLISKDVGGQRWAITRNLGDGSVTGNVYLPEGGDPVFLFCTQTSATVEQVELSCYGADRCPAAPCTDQFDFIADVELPTSFFLPTEVGAGAAQAASGVALRVERTSGGTVRESGLQITPDGLRTLVSKDVGGERWAITRNTDDDTVTGNVYQPGGGDALFLFCTQTGVAGENLMLSCSGANRCEAAPCDPAQFAFIADVELPVSFFEPPGADELCGNGVLDGPDEECDGADLNGADCTLATLSFEDCSGALTCGPDCRFDVSACDCPCIGDFDCGVSVDCTQFFPECELDGACQAGRCVVNSSGTQEICEGVDPEDPEFARCE